MDRDTYQDLAALFTEGDFRLLAQRLRPFLKNGDADARYLAAHFSNDPKETNEDFDRRNVTELQSLAKEWYPKALYRLGWLYRFGDNGLEEDMHRFRTCLMAAALLGHEEAIQYWAERAEDELERDGLQKLLGLK